MVKTKKISVSFPKDMLDELDAAVFNLNKNRSMIIREAITFYLSRSRQSLKREDIKKGYIEMSEINLKLARMCFDADENQYARYDKKLGEMGKT